MTHREKRMLQALGGIAGVALSILLGMRFVSELNRLDQEIALNNARTAQLIERGRSLAITPDAPEKLRTRIEALRFQAERMYQGFAIPRSVDIYSFAEQMTGMIKSRGLSLEQMRVDAQRRVLTLVLSGPAIQSLEWLKALESGPVYIKTWNWQFDRLMQDGKAGNRVRMTMEVGYAEFEA